MVRFVVAPILGLSIALSLFVLDHQLISGPIRPDREIVSVKLDDFVRVSRDSAITTKERRIPKKPPPPERPPPPQKFRVETPDTAPKLPVAIDVPKIGISVGGGSGPYLGPGFVPNGDYTGDAEVVPIVRIQPQYPRRALLEGIEGWVELSFTIMKDGSVAEVSVTDAEPKRLFNQSAIRALMRWKFRPRVVDGNAIERRASQVIAFRLDDTA